MNDTYVYEVQFPTTAIREAVVKGIDGDTIYLDCRMSRSGKLSRYAHAVSHINGSDLENRQDKSATHIEKERH